MDGLVQGYFGQVIIYAWQDSCNIQAWSNTFHTSRVSSITKSKPSISYRKDIKWSVFMASEAIICEAFQPQKVEAEVKTGVNKVV